MLEVIRSKGIWKDSLNWKGLERLDMIREIREDDFQMYMELTKEFYESDATDHPVPESYREATWKELMRSREYASAYILEFGDEVAGYGLMSYTFSQEAGGMVAWIEEVYIRPRYRGRGLGREFFSYVDAVIAPKVMRLRLEVEPDNVRAKKLYRELGYKELPYEQMLKEVQEVE